jgi:hypothetical protein
MSNHLGIHELEEGFPPKTMPTDSKHDRILILDDHGSYVTIEFIYKCFINVSLILLPHVLQPLN